MLSSITCHSQLPYDSWEHLTVTEFPRPLAKLSQSLTQGSQLEQKKCIVGYYFFVFTVITYWRSPEQIEVFNSISLFLTVACSLNEGLAGTADASVKLRIQDGRRVDQVETIYLKKCTSVWWIGLVITLLYLHVAVCVSAFMSESITAVEWPTGSLSTYLKQRAASVTGTLTVLAVTVPPLYLLWTKVLF